MSDEQTTEKGSCWFTLFERKKPFQANEIQQGYSGRFSAPDPALYNGIRNYYKRSGQPLMTELTVEIRHDSNYPCIHFALYVFKKHNRSNREREQTVLAQNAH